MDTRAKGAGAQIGRISFPDPEIIRGSADQVRVKRHCTECMGGDEKMVRVCHTRRCALHPWRLGKDEPTYYTPLTRRESMALQCLECCGGVKAEAQACQERTCWLWRER